MASVKLLRVEFSISSLVLLLVLLVLTRQAKLQKQMQDEHGNDRTEMSMRWHSFHNEPIAVSNMRADCMGSALKIISIDMIVNGGECHKNTSDTELNQIAARIEECSRNDICHEVKWDHRRLAVKNDCIIYPSAIASVCFSYIRQYQEQCMKNIYTELRALTVSGLDIQFSCERPQETTNMKVSVIKTTEQQHINIGHMIMECNSQHENKYLNIHGFVEVSSSCPADKANYRPPEYHEMVQVIQEHVNKVKPLIAYTDYRYNLSLRVVCGNLLIPVMLDGLVAMSSVQGWIYYECGDHTVANYTWSHRWFNISSQYKNDSHTIRHSTAISTYCPHAASIKLLIVSLLILLAGALVVEGFTIYKRDRIAGWFSQQTMRPIRAVEDQPTRGTDSTATSVTTLNSACNWVSSHQLVNNGELTTQTAGVLTLAAGETSRQKAGTPSNNRAAGGVAQTKSRDGDGVTHGNMRAEGGVDGNSERPMVEAKRAGMEDSSQRP